MLRDSLPSVRAKRAAYNRAVGATNGGAIIVYHLYRLRCVWCVSKCTTGSGGVCQENTVTELNVTSAKFALAFKAGQLPNIDPDDPQFVINLDGLKIISKVDEGRPKTEGPHRAVRCRRASWLCRVEIWSCWTPDFSSWMPLPGHLQIVARLRPQLVSGLRRKYVSIIN